MYNVRIHCTFSIVFVVNYASTFKNAEYQFPVVDTSASNLFAAASSTAVIHALYISNKSTTASATVDVKVTTDAVSTFYHIVKV